MLEALPLDLATAVCRSVTTHGDLPRFAGSCRALSRVVRRMLRDRSAHSVWRLLCSSHQPGAGAFVGVTDYCALYFRLRGLQAPSRTEMTISDLQLIMNVTMWTGEPGDTHRSEVVFAQVLHGAQASIAIPSSEDGLAQVEGDLGYKWSVPNGNRLLELAGLGEPTARLSSGHNQIDGWSDRRVQLKQLEGLAMESHDYFVMRPPGQLPTWAVNQAQYAETRVGKRTWVLSLSAFRPSDQKTVQLMSEVALNLNYGNPDDSMVRFLSWEHTAIKSLTASHERAHAASSLASLHHTATTYCCALLLAPTTTSTSTTSSTTCPCATISLCAPLSFRPHELRS